MGHPLDQIFQKFYNNLFVGCILLTGGLTVFFSSTLTNGLASFFSISANDIIPSDDTPFALLTGTIVGVVSSALLVVALLFCWTNFSAFSISVVGCCASLIKRKFQYKKEQNGGRYNAYPTISQFFPFNEPLSNQHTKWGEKHTKFMLQRCFVFKKKNSI